MVFRISGVSSLVDVVVFLIVSWGIYKISRTAAIFGLIIYILEQIDYWLSYGSQNWLMVCFLILAFINSIRGTFLYYQYRKEEPGNNPSVIRFQLRNSSLGKISLTIFTFVLFANIIIYLLEYKTHLNTTSGTLMGAILGTTSVLGSLLGGVTGVILSIIGIFQKNHKKILSILGFILNTTVCVFVLNAINEFSKLAKP